MKLIGLNEWVLIIMLAPNPGVYEGLSHDIITFESQALCQKARGHYLKIITQHWVNSKSYVSECFDRREKW